MASFFGRLLSGQGEDLGYPLAARMAKVVTFAAFVEAVHKRKVPLQLHDFITWSNSWLAPELRAVDTGKKIAVYDDHPISGSRYKYYQESYRWFNPNLTVASKYKVTYNGLTDKEKEVHHRLAQVLTDALGEHIYQAYQRRTSLGTFDADEILKRLWRELVGGLDARVQSSFVDRL